jgi:hypothetical protein
MGQRRLEQGVEMARSGLWAVAVLALPLAASAAISAQDALQRVIHAEREEGAFLVQYPMLRPVDAAVRNACATKAAGKAPTGGYCTCAAAVVMSAWRSGVDPNMLRRLSAYANAPDPDAASALLRYQGPELYAPLCTAARLAD